MSTRSPPLVWWWLDAIVSVAVAFVLSFALFRFLPETEVTPREATTSAMVSTVLFALGSGLVTAYVHHKHMHDIYAGEGVAVIDPHGDLAEAVIDAFRTFKGKPQALELPSAPRNPVVYLTERNRPQPALDANRDGGMTVSVGRLRPCLILDYKFFALGHNTIRGAAGAAILNAELMHREGVL